MRRRKRYKNKLMFMLLVLLTIGLGIGYAIFTQQLTINNTVSFSSMKWDVGFSKIEDNGGTILSTGNISADGTTITVNCDFGTSISQESCISKFTITNNSAFNIGLSGEPIIEYDDTYINTLTFKWNNHPTFLNSTVHENGFIAQGESEEVILTIKSKFLDAVSLPFQAISIPIKITLNFEEWQDGELPQKEDLAILPKLGCTSTGDLAEPDIYGDFAVQCSEIDTTALDSSFYIKTLTFEKGNEIPQEVIDNNAVSSLTENGDIVMYSIINEEYSSEENTFYDIYINSEKQIYANEDMAYYFAGMTNLEEINGLELLDTSMTTNMEGTFYYMGIDSPTTNIDFSSLDTSNVTNMKNTFFGVGSYPSESTSNINKNINISSIDTSKVEDMSYMLTGAGSSQNLTSSTSYATTLTETSNTEETEQIISLDLNIDVNNFNTSNVTNMRGMFLSTGVNLPDFELDVSNFDTKKVTDMSWMFVSVGTGTNNLTLDLSSFDTSNVTNMSYMFALSGLNSLSFKLNLSNFDTRKVTDMSYMFTLAGNNNPNFTLDVSNFNTSNVTNMKGMFQSTGISNTEFILDVSNFDTSNVTNMDYMFSYTGHESTNFTLDVSKFDTSKVTSMSYMFSNAGYNNPNFTLDVSKFDTSKVTNMSNMFQYTGYTNPNFKLDVSNFDTSNVTDMSYMLYQTGYNSTKLNTSLTIKNPNTNSYSRMFYGVATKTGASITVNYTSETSTLVDSMIATKSSGANVVKGEQVS